MNPYNLITDDLLDGDPRFDHIYHQDFREGIQRPHANTEKLFALFFCCIPIVYHILYILDFDLLPLPELFWNIIVYFTPSRLLDTVDNYQNPLRISNPVLAGIPRTHAAKSEVMRRVLGMDKPGGIIAAVGRVRGTTLSGKQGIAAQKNDERPAGLGNWDNSCYQNSVLQGLASLESLSEYLSNPKIKGVAAEVKDKEEMKMAEALKGLISRLKDPNNNGRRIWTPATLKNMSSWQQQDAQEYFSKVLDEIEKEIGNAANLAQVPQGLEADEEPSAESKTSSRLPISTFKNPLEGLIAQRVGCTKCGYSEGLSMTPFNCLTVPLTKAWEHELSECLDEYTKLELIEGVECGKCTLLKTQRLLSMVIERTKDSPDDIRAHKASKERLEAVSEALEDDDYEEKTLRGKCNINPKNRVSSTKTRQAVIARPPKSLVVHFNRSLFDERTGELRKNPSRVRFAKRLNLASWCLGSAGTSEDKSTEEWLLNPELTMISSSRYQPRTIGPIYEIRGVVTHYGRHENGHYICYRKHPVRDPEEKPIDQWWRLSDDDVVKVSEEQVFGLGDRESVFMLFYESVEPAHSKAAPAHENTPITSVETTYNAGVLGRSTNPGAPCKVHTPDDLGEDIKVAASIPLPEEDDYISESEYQDSSSTTREASLATTISEFEDEEKNDENQDPDSTRLEAAQVTKHIRQSSVEKDPKGPSDSDVASPGLLVMV